MSGQHTPGPWRAVVRSNQLGPRTVQVATDKGQGGVWGIVNGPRTLTEANVADARLIAAAPELLEALVGLLGDAPANDVDGNCRHCGRDNSDHEGAACSDDCAGQIARAAIAKATGAA